jgi:addiction module HigA family antidote
MMYNPAHPGEIVQEHMKGLGLTVTALAAHLKVTRAALSRIVNGRAAVSADMALRLSAAFGTSPEVWIQVQAQYDLWQASKARRVKIAPIVKKAA